MFQHPTQSLRGRKFHSLSSQLPPVFSERCCGLDTSVLIPHGLWAEISALVWGMKRFVIESDTGGVTVGDQDYLGS